LALVGFQVEHACEQHWPTIETVARRAPSDYLAASHAIPDAPHPVVAAAWISASDGSLVRAFIALFVGNGQASSSRRPSCICQIEAQLDD